MKIVSFKIPKTQKDTYHFQVDSLDHFYDKLHQHPEVQVTLIEKSTGTLIAGDHIGKFEPGDVLIIGSSLPHVFRNDQAYYKNKRKDKALGLSLYVDIKVWEDSFWSGKETMAVGHFFKGCYSAYKVQGKLKTLLSQQLRHIEKLSGYERLLCMLEMLYQVYKKKRNLQLISGGEGWNMIKENDGMRMNEVIRFTLEEYQRDISLKEVAGVANMTIEAFCRYFKLHTRKTYISFLNEIRINNACRLLTEAKLSKAEIADRVGFNNLSHFNRTFKRITGKTPGEYAEILS